MMTEKPEHPRGTGLPSRLYPLYSGADGPGDPSHAVSRCVRRDASRLSESSLSGPFFPDGSFGMKPRTIAVGDIHGCSVAFNRLLEVIQPHEPDTLIVLGDIIDRGPDSRGVIEKLIQLDQQCQLIALLGNHEEMFFAARESRSDFLYWTKFGGLAMLDSYPNAATCSDIPRSHQAFLERCRSYHETDQFIFLHANYDAHLPLERQSPIRLRWDHLQPAVAQPHCSGKTVVVGHTPQASGEVLDLGFLVCLDTGCCDGGWLSSLDVQTGQIWQANQRGEVRSRERISSHG